MSKDLRFEMNAEILIVEDDADAAKDSAATALGHNRSVRTHGKNSDRR